MVQVRFFLLIDLHFRGQTLYFINPQISRKQQEAEQTLLLSSNRKSCLGYQLAYLHLTLAKSSSAMANISQTVKDWTIINTALI